MTHLVWDMDGTLLDPSGRAPDDFWPLADTARERGITIAPASGRQLATLQAMFPGFDTFIAENGAVVWHGGRVVSTTALPAQPVQRLRQPFGACLAPRRAPRHQAGQPVRKSRPGRQPFGRQGRDHAFAHQHPASAQQRHDTVQRTQQGQIFQPEWMAAMPPDRLRQDTRSKPAVRIIDAKFS